jgi:hypothetical protein
MTPHQPDLYSLTKRHGHHQVSHLDASPIQDQCQLDQINRHQSSA